MHSHRTIILKRAEGRVLPDARVALLVTQIEVIVIFLCILERAREYLVFVWLFIIIFCYC